MLPWEPQRWGGRCRCKGGVKPPTVATATVFWDLKAQACGVSHTSISAWDENPGYGYALACIKECACTQRNTQVGQHGIELLDELLEPSGYHSAGTFACRGSSIAPLLQSSNQHSL